MANLNIAKAPANSAVLPFYGAAALFFIFLCFLLLYCSHTLLGGYFNFHLLAIVHIAVLGWLTMIIFGACYQLLPVICEKDLHSESLAFVSFFLLLTGIILLAAGFWQTGNLAGIFPWWGLAGGALIFTASLLFTLNIARTTRICRNYSIQKTFILASAIWLNGTALAGFLLAWNLHDPYISKSHLDLLKLHAHMGLAGWFLQLIIGVSVKLIPMFLLGKSDKNYLLTRAFILINGGMVLFLADGFFEGLTLRSLLYLGLILSGIVLWMAYLKDVYKNRIKRPVDISLRFSGISFVNLILTLGCLVGILCCPWGGQGQVVYGMLAILGWLSSLALGMTFKTLPFIVWNGHYRHLNGKGRIPLPKELYRQWLLKLQWWLYIIAIYGLLAGISWRQELLLKTALICLCGTSLSYGLNVLIILKHKTSFTYDNATTTQYK